MPGYLLSPVANARLDEIYRHTKDTWGEAQANHYIRALFHCFERIAAREIPWKIVPAEFEVQGFWHRCEHHFIYWRERADGRVGFVTILHERMHQIERFREDWG